MVQSIRLLLRGATEEDCLLFEGLIAGKSYLSSCPEYDEVSYTVSGLSLETVEQWSKQHQSRVELLAEF